MNFIEIIMNNLIIILILSGCGFVYYKWFR